MSKRKAPKIKELESVRLEISKGLKDISDENIVVTRLDLGENAYGFRWQLYRGKVPFWIDLMRFNDKLDLLVVYSMMFVIPETWEGARKAELYKFLLTLNDFSMSWDTKFFLKENSVILCASRGGDEITKETSRTLVENFTSFAKALSIQVGEKFPDALQLVVEKMDSGSSPE